MRKESRPFEKRALPGSGGSSTATGQGELIAELLEVTQVPEILASASDEIAAAARALREHISRGRARPC